MIYDHLGREIEVIVKETLPSGNHILQWHPRDGVSGVYFFYLLIDELNSNANSLAWTVGKVIYSK